MQFTIGAAMLSIEKKFQQWLCVEQSCELFTDNSSRELAPPIIGMHSSRRLGGGGRRLLEKVPLRVEPGVHLMKGLSGLLVV